MRYEGWMIAVLRQSPSPSPPACLRSSDLCHWIYDETGIRWLASSSYYVLVKPAQILLIVVLAVVIRFVLHRVINRLIHRTVGGSVPAILRPLKERLAGSLADGAVVFTERRRQRAEAIGSVLRSFTTALVFSIAGLMILAQLGMDLAPVLASAGIAGIALGFGAQSLVKDVLAGLSMLLEDQYGVGDVIDVGEASGTVEAVGLRTTTIRDARGVVWYIRNGEIVRVGNKSQGWAVVMVDVPIGFASVDRAMEVIRTAADELAHDETFAEDLIEPPTVLGVEQLSVDGAVLRTTVKVAPAAQWRVGRELRLRLTEALNRAGIASQLGSSLRYVRPAIGPEGSSGGPADPIAGQ